jgi:putative transposase
MKRLVDTEEAARVLEMTIDAVKKRFQRGQLQGEYQKSAKGGGKAGQKLFLWIDDSAAAMESTDGSTQQQVETACSDRRRDRYKVHQGDPSSGIITDFKDGKPIINIAPFSKPTGDGGGDLISAGQSAVPANRESPQAILSSSSPPPPRLEEPRRASQPCEVIPLASQGTLFPAILEDRTANPKQEETGYLRMALLKTWREKIGENGKSKGQVTKEFLQCYNSGHLFPNIYDRVDKISRATLYNWDRTERLGGVSALIPQYHSPDPSPITDYEKYILLNTLLHQNRVKIGTAIKFTKTFITYKKYPSPSSESKLRRFVDDFRKTHYPAWVSAREGAKALNDKCLPYAERDWRLLTVGEGLVADGHRLNFQVINPFNGKPCRATIVLFWDWKSSYPLGWEIMVEESTQCIASALRNAILTLGKKPKWLLIDNGKAFKAKVFTSEIELEDGILYGMFATLGIHTHFSQAYNPQEKPLERFWGTFNNWFERLLPSYTGASINDKPAYMMRNEKDAQARHNKWVPRIEEVQGLLRNWREFYANQPSRGRDGMKPGEIFEAEKGPGIDPGELYHLMMAKEKMQVHRNGVTFNGWHYYDEALYGIKDYVVGKYSLSDFSEIYCFYKNQLLCVAKPIEKVHPMASESEYPKDHEAVKRIASLKHRVRRGTKNLLNLIETGRGDLGESLQRSPEIAEVVKAIEDKQQPQTFTSAFVEDNAPSPQPSAASRCDSKPRDEGEKEIVVDPRSGLNRPTDGTIFSCEIERYDWYMEVMKKDPALINEADRQWIAEYEATDQWMRIYKPIQTRG